jgi:hypothetical protein
MTSDAKEPRGVAELSLAAHHEEAREREAEREADRREQEARLEARRNDPRELGLEECPECGWWRDPIPDIAWRSVEAFRTYLRMAKVRCLCTSHRCSGCHELMHPEFPTPVYYDPARRRLVRSGGFAAGMSHFSRCEVRQE